MLITKDSLVVFVLFVAMLITAVVVVYIPQGHKIDELTSQIVTNKRELDEQMKRVSAIPDLVRHINAMQKRYSSFNARMPQEQELGAFLEEINDHLSHGDFSGQSIEPGTPTREDLFHTLPIIMKFRGSYLALGRFLEQLDSMERLSRVQKLTIISGKGSKADSSKLEIELHLNIYYTANTAPQIGVS